MTGFHPRTTRPPSTLLRTSLLFRRTWPKACWPCHGPLPPQGQALRGASVVHRYRAACKLAEPVLSLVEGLRHCPPVLRCRLHGSALPPGQGTLKKELGTKMDARRRMPGMMGCESTVLRSEGIPGNTFGEHEKELEKSGLNLEPFTLRVF